MTKRKWRTVLGLALSLCIAFGGWLLTGWLIDLQSDTLLSQQGRVYTQASPVTAAPDAAVRVLSDQEIADILSVWQSSRLERLHEPSEGQTSMEGAIAASKEFMSTFGDAGILYSEFRGLDVESRVEAYLCVNYDEQLNRTFGPEHSYWKVSLTNTKFEAIFTINAVTGQVWKAEFVPNTSDAFLDELDIEKILGTFVQTLSLDAETPKTIERVETGNNDVAYVWAIGDSLGALMVLDGRFTDDEVFYTRFQVGLTSQPFIYTTSTYFEIFY